ncbi:MAG: DUF1178 family protein [Pseudomonadota bacterium]
MIAFDLRCQHGHVFEAWFGSSKDYDAQKQNGLLSCPICGDTTISKAIMAPNVGRKGNQAAPVKPAAAPAPVQQPTAPVPAAMPAPPLPPEVAEKLMNVAAQVKEHVEKNCDYVGKDFAEEARKIHYGETDERGIYGEATPDEAEELIEEGVDVVALPFVRPPNSFDA